MYILRNVVLDDLDDLFELSSTVLFINLPHDKDLIKHKIKSSIKAFNNPNADLSKNYYLFVLEDYENKKVIGVSMIHAQHGTEEEPHFFLEVGSEHKYSKTINTGFVHGTLKLGLDTDGPTEIGGLVVSASYRGDPEKLGKQISFVRFLYMGLNQKRFKPYIHSELMPPFDEYGKAPLWEAIGRRFMNMDYNEADVLSRNNKEFILNLFPSENIYMTLLPPDARNAVGKVGKETLGVRKMLKEVGFKYTSQVDPFDGGPHFRCPLKDIKPIKDLQNFVIATNLNHVDEESEYILNIPSKNFDFLAYKATLAVNFQEQACIIKNTLPKELGVDPGTTISCIPF